MKVFRQLELKQALAYAAEGETAVHLHWMVFPNSPKCFRDAVAKGYPIAHVFSQDAELLIELASRSGVKRIVIGRPGTSRQHVDMCCSPLRDLMLELGDDIENYRIRNKL
jgi:hypothetical protein